MKSSVTAVGRILLALPFLILGFFHFMKGPDMAAYMLSGWPAATLLVYLAGAGLVLGAIAVILNKMAKLAGLLLALEMIIFVIALWIPQIMDAADEAARSAPMSGMLKDLGLAGGALLIAAMNWDKK